MTTVLLSVFLRFYIKNTICEPFLTKYNLTKNIGGFERLKKEGKNIRNVISYVGKNYDLTDISKKEIYKKALQLKND